MRNFDRAANIYDSTRALPDPAMKAVLEAFETELRDSKSILDAGVGTGRFAAPLRERGLDVVGLDVSKSMLAEAKKKLVTSLVRGELTTMPFVDKAFDSCLMVHVLHLVENPADLLSEIVRVCKTEVLSLAETSDYVSVREEYIRILSEFGYHWGNLTEQKLTIVVPPTELKEIVSYSVEKRADDDIGYFRERLSAVTWDVPDQVHERIIGKLSSGLGGRVLRFNTTIKLVKWNIDRLQTADLSLQ